MGNSRAVAARLDLVSVEVHVDEALVRLDNAVLEAGYTHTARKRLQQTRPAEVGTVDMRQHVHTLVGSKLTSDAELLALDG